jgi:hypothetical protein
VTQFDLSRSIQPTIDAIQSIFPVSECSLPTRQGDTQYQSVILELKDPTFIAMSGYSDTLDQIWDHYKYTPSFSSAQSFAANVSFDDLTNNPDRGFASAFVADQFLRADLGRIEDVNRVTVSAGQLTGVGGTAALLNGAQIQTSIDGIQWTHVQTISGVTDTNGKQTFTLPQTNYCRYVRLFQPSGSGIAIVGLWINA